ncbi:MAG: glycosyltransferase family 4 protein [Holosporales bacterium]|jgi:glycosyltransferase involved in cell wall biosynthesis|nr:glycosyltransferase family 4 protein [Holosporales bacterium]
MVKVLHVCSGKGPGGTRTVFLAHQKLFSKLEVIATPVLRRKAAIKSNLTKEAIERVEEIDYYRRFPIKMQPVYKKMAKLACNNDIIWVHKPIDAYIWRQVSPNSKIVLVVHGFQNTNLKEADYLVAVSVPVLEHLERKGLKNAFLVNNFLPESGRSKEITWNKKIQISSFGFFRRKKGFTDLIKAIDILKNEFFCSNFNVDIYGNGRLGFVLRLMKHLKKLANLRINDWTNDVFSCLSKTDVVVIPSRSESFSMVTIEAMLSGCLVVATKCRGPEYIISNNVNGILVEKSNPKQMALKLQCIISDPQNFTNIRKNAIKMVIEKFSISNSIDAMKIVLQMALG